MATSEFPLPDVGEGLTEAEIVAWKVQPGDAVALNQVIVEIETAKSLVELPSPFVGTVSELLVQEGDTVEVGTPIITVTSGADATTPAAPVAPATAATAPAQPAAAPTATAPAAAPAVTPSPGLQDSAVTEPAETPAPAVVADATAEEEVADVASTIAAEPAATPATPANLVGYGAKGHGASRRRRVAGAAKPAVRPRAVPAASGSSVLAKPPVRKLAKDLGVELGVVTPTGVSGDITRDDVIRQAQQASVFRNIQTPEWPAEREERIPVKGVRKAIAKAMVRSAFTAPHVSVFVDVDATRTMEFVKRLKNSADFAGVRISPLLIMAKAMIWAVRRNPTVNSTWTDEEIIVHHFVNLGVAAATPRGLIVPNVKDAQAMSLLQLATALEQLTITAREGKTQPAQMADGTITITNLGSFGMDTGTPILNPGEVAIVALGTIKQKPWVVDGEVRARYVTTIGASFDHRIVDGDVASRFLADVASIIEEPALLLD
ncbi:pyruvate dehydrogenase E2 component (dihydrolipoamide acetyltransferase) [Diaminobutyricimonas aerilata]|uniref:Dihydrolipoamide acetyltransferase component of pyruvate dehydrogenase complex n=1 Tax=Diaminobutyricimonas aerilata TaxID=1162967 RepID=A0A2M9CP53_9MICO|nr:dihydrolipoamide acetyltransferase family protein [Diaminobutyricimonas aerilata]PJJ73679.1 pyruvate dehydrogenase E2 component (dihydrolipoamide acetyltransferase) [Diaminobutyricimonas aerilata]